MTVLLFLTLMRVGLTARPGPTVSLTNIGRIMFTEF